MPIEKDAMARVLVKAYDRCNLQYRGWYTSRSPAYLSGSSWYVGDNLPLLPFTVCFYLYLVLVVVRVSVCHQLGLRRRLIDVLEDRMEVHPVIGNDGLFGNRFENASLKDIDVLTERRLKDPALVRQIEDFLRPYLVVQLHPPTFRENGSYEAIDWAIVAIPIILNHLAIVFGIRNPHSENVRAALHFRTRIESARCSGKNEDYPVRPD